MSFSLGWDFHVPLLSGPSKHKTVTLSLRFPDQSLDPFSQALFSHGQCFWSWQSRLRSMLAEGCTAGRWRLGMQEAPAVPVSLQCMERGCPCSCWESSSLGGQETRTSVLPVPESFISESRQTLGESPS